MARKIHGGGFPAIKYVLDMADRVGWMKLWRAMRSKNACKTCALGMGGQLGGMRNEAGHWPEVCKKSLQAMVADMQDGIRPEFFSRYGLAELRGLTPRELESAGRLVHPMHAGPDSTHYTPIGWETALDQLAKRLRAADPRRVFFYVSGRSSNEAGFLLQLFARLYGTNHVNNCSYYCHQASGVGLTSSIGTGTATVTLDDVEQADLFFLIGANPASNHPRLMRTLMGIRRRGGRVVAINPLRENGLINFRVPSDLRSLIFGSQVASDYVQPHIGGDIALLMGMARRLIERGRVDRSFIEQSTEGWSDFSNAVMNASWSDIVASSGVSRAEIERLADLYAEAKNVIFGWTMGITHHEHGVDNVRMIVNLALMRGMIGRRNAGLLPIRGHSNVQGIGSVGVTPQLRDAIFERLQSRCGVQLPDFKGYDTMRCMEAASRGEMDVGICLGGNLFGANPDAAFATHALESVGLVVYLSTTLNTGHLHGMGCETLVLPVLPRDEEQQATTQESMFSYVRLSDGGPPRHAGPRSEVSIIAQLAQHVLNDQTSVNWRSLETHRTIRQWIAEVVPGYEKIAQIDQTRGEFHVEGRAFHAPRFATPNGRARFCAVTIPRESAPFSHDEPQSSEAGPQNELSLRLMTIRSEGQFNTVVYEEEDLYRGQDRRDIILLSEQDMQTLSVKENDRVWVRSATGQMRHILARAFDIRPGNAAMYYPEANVLVPRRVDPQSGTPAFKNVSVTVTKEPLAHWQPDGRLTLLQSGDEKAHRTLNAC